MSIKAVSWALAQPIPAIPKLVLIAICECANEDGVSWPSQKYIARVAGVTDRSVRTWLKWLGSEGFVTRNERARPDGSRTTDSFILPPEGRSGGEEGFSSAPRKDVPHPRKQLLPDPPENTLPGYEPSVNRKDKAIDCTSKKKRCQIPETFIPSDALVIKLRLVWSLADIGRERQKFIDYHRAKGNTFLDHDRAFQNWMGNAKEFKANGRTRSAPVATDPSGREYEEI